MAFGAINKNYISSINFLDQREILNEILDVTNEADSLVDVLDLMGAAELTAVPDYHHFINSELYTKLAVTSAAQVGGVNTTLDLTVTNVADVQKGQLIRFLNKKVGFITGITGSVVTVKSVDGTNLCTVVGDLASSNLPVFSNAAGEGSGGPESIKYGQTKEYNQVQIFEGYTELTDIQMASKVETTFNGQPYYMLKAQHEALMKFNGDISLGLLFSRISTSKFSDGSGAALVDREGNPVQTTRGLDQYCTDFGTTLTTAAADTFSVDDLKALTRLLAKKRAPKEFIMAMGSEGNIVVDDLLSALGDATATLMNATFNVGGRVVDLGVDQFNVYGYKYFKKAMPILDHQNLVNYTGSPQDQFGIYLIPTGQVKTLDGKMRNRLNLRYMAQSGAASRYQEILTGGLAPNPTNDKRVLGITYYATMGLDVAGAQHFGKITIQ